MRDPRRIPILIDELKTFWIKNADLRLGQMMLIAGEKAGCGEDIWNIEDKELIDALTGKNEWGKGFSQETIDRANELLESIYNQREEVQ